MTSFDPVWYPPRTLGLAHASFSPSTLGESGEQLTSSPTFRFAAAALSSGSIVHGEEYAWSYSLESDTSGAVNSGNGLWFSTGTSAGSPAFSQWISQTQHAEHVTRHPYCVSSNGLGEYLLVWTSRNQVPPFADPAGSIFLWPFSGARAVYYKQSFDGGRTWGATTLHPSGTTRSGVSCAYDVARGQHVLLFASSQGEGLFVASLPEGGGASWAGAQQLGVVPGRTVIPTSTDTPSIDFDTLGNGVIGWYDNIDRGSAGAIQWNSSTSAYEWVAGGVSSATTTEQARTLRSRIVALNYSPHRQVTYNVNPSGTHRRRFRVQLNPTRIETTDNNFSTTFRSAYAAIARSSFGFGYRVLSFTWNGAE